MIRVPDFTALVAGAAIAALGVLLVLDADGRIHLGFAYAAPVALGIVGAILLAGGLARRRRG